eukprot:TRINITY_DN2113_c0_g1_i12.p1 TRINITY_DN2113_c0_g1~~TRINITY_DN2113_c0_g1_i12.p1  ORF type:complete len:215 (-),score=20.20 TRINITY_DN2113_c0_g1_i12:23-667(-)
MPGFEGNGTDCTDVDECQFPNPYPCASDACNNTIGSFECLCQSGYHGAPCTDINECLTNPCDSFATCENLNGSYYCDCNNGYFGNGSYCEDWDECSTNTSLCSLYSECENNHGSYHCDCWPGFEGDGFVCNDINECDLFFGECSNGKCNNTDGGFFCTCNSGFQLAGVICNDIDECSNATYPCHANASCRNSIGEIGRAVQQECRDRSRMPSSA